MVVVIGIGLVVAMIWLVAYGMDSAGDTGKPRLFEPIGAHTADEEKPASSDVRHAA